jgi:DNA polymerase I
MKFIQAPDPIWVTDEDEAAELCQYFIDLGEPYSFDTEASTVVGPKAELIVWSISDGEDRYCLPRHLAHTFKPLWESDIPTIAWNAKYDLWVMHNAGIEIADPVWDGLVMDWLVDENNLHGLKDRAEKLLGFEMADFKSVFGGPYKQDIEEGRDAGWFIRRMMDGGATRQVSHWEGGEEYVTEEKISAEEGLAIVVNYAALDAWATQRIVMDFLIPKLKKERLGPEQNYWEWFKEVEVPITRILWEMEQAGFHVNTDHLESLKGTIGEQLQACKEGAAVMLGEPINLNSPPQKSKAIFGHFGVDPSYSKKTTTGYSTDKDTLTRVMEHCDEEDDKDVLDFCRNILEFQSVGKMQGTYIKPLIRRTDDKTGRIRTNLNQHITVTGRLSSSDPNLQNIPIRSELGREIRRAFTSDPKRGTILIGADYASLEMRIMAHFSQDRGMIEAINDGLDPHCDTAAMMFDIPYEDLVAAKNAKDSGAKLNSDDKELVGHRASAKTIGFGQIYGQGVFALAESLGITRREAADKQNKFFDARPGFKRFIDETHAAVRRDLHVRTLFGRKRRLYMIRSTKRGQVAQALRQSVNSIIQGSAAEIAKLAMILCAQDDRLRDRDCDLLLQVHDELIFELEDDDELVGYCQPIIKDHMESALIEPMAVPLIVDIHSGHSWVDVH